MGDLSAEPSMEDILSSIKRIIAEEGDQPARRARPARTALPELEDEVLELSEPLPPRVESAPPPRAEPAPRAPEARAEPPVEATPRTFEPARPAMPATPEPIVSSETAAASRGALEVLSRMMVKPEPGSDGTLEGLVREMLRPMLREWLDAHLPDMVESLVSREIARIAGQTP